MSKNKEKKPTSLAQNSQTSGKRRTPVGKKPNPLHSHEPSDEMDLYINWINSQKLSWKANTCLLSKTDPNYDHEKCSGADAAESLSSLAQTSKIHWKENDKKPKKKHNTVFQKNEESGKGKFGEDTAEFKKAAAKAQSWLKKYRNTDEIPDSVIPDAWDFRNIGNYDFTGDLRDQKECGSCFTMGYIQTVEARMKLKYAQKASKL